MKKKASVKKPIVKNKIPITPKQKKFADALIQTDNKTKAAMIAYPKATYAVARSIWCRNATKHNIVEYLKDNAGIAAAFMTSVIENPNDRTSDRITAAKDVMDRAWYKPVDRSEEKNFNIDIKIASMEELLALIKK